MENAVVALLEQTITHVQIEFDKEALFMFDDIPEVCPFVADEFSLIAYMPSFNYSFNPRIDDLPAYLPQPPVTFQTYPMNCTVSHQSEICELKSCMKCRILMHQNISKCYNVMSSWFPL